MVLQLDFLSFNPSLVVTSGGVEATASVAVNGGGVIPFH